jgi:hypothetical protein
MTLDNRTKVSALAWSIVILLVAFFANVGSLAGWIVASVLAFGPALTLVYFCREPAQTTSERIREARR